MPLRTRRNEWSRFSIIWEILKQRAKDHENWGLGPIRKFFYSLKCVICVLINRQRDLWADDEAIDSIACFDFHKWQSQDFCGYAVDWDEVAVGRGIFRRWYFDIYENSSA